MRPFPALVAALILALAWVPDWDVVLAPFPAHMLRHMALVSLAAPALVLALPSLTRIAPPVVLAAALEFAVVWGAHLPALHGAAQGSPGLFALEQAAFLAVGVAVWASALPPGDLLPGAGALLLTSMHMTLLGALLILAPTDLYAEICRRAPNLSGQQFGGVLMLAIGTPVYLAGGLWLTGTALRERPA